MTTATAAITRALGNATSDFGNYSAKAASNANAVSRASQAAQGQFNQASVDNANSLNQNNMISQYDFNAAQAASANEFTSQMWDKAADFNRKAWIATALENQRQWQQSADYNREMWQKEADFNSYEAEKNRNWQKMMSDTQITRAAEDMKRAGLNPILAIQNGAGIGSGATASVGGSSMSGIGMNPTSMGSAQGIAAQGGLLGANSASEGNYVGQMEYMGGLLGLLSALINSGSSAVSQYGTLGDIASNVTDYIEEGIGYGFNDLKKGVKNVVNNVFYKTGDKLQKASDKLERAITKEKINSYKNKNNLKLP